MGIVFILRPLFFCFRNEFLHRIDGIKGKQYDTIIQDILQTYGHEYVTTIRNLEKLSFLRRTEV